MNELLSTKQLASALGRSLRYIQYMKAQGFQMPGGLATIAEARSFQARNLPPCPPPKWRNRVLHVAAHRGN